MKPLFCCANLALLAVLLTEISAQISSVCTFSPTIDGRYRNMTLNATALVNSEAVTGTEPVYKVNADGIDYMGMQVVKNGGEGPDIGINFNVEMVDTKQSPDLINISLTLTNSDALSISAVTMKIELGTSVKAFWEGSGIPNGSALIERSSIEFNTNLSSGSSVAIYFRAVPAGQGGVDLPAGNSEFYAAVYFTFQNVDYGTILPSICLRRILNLKHNILYEHGFTAVTFFIMFFVGIGLAILGIWLFLHIQHKRAGAAVSPASSDVRFCLPYKRIKKEKEIVLDAEASMKQGIKSIKTFSVVAWNESILCILTLKDKLHMHREIDNLDILSTTKIETDLETEQIDCAVQASVFLVRGLRHNGDISKTFEDKANTNMQNQLKELEKRLNAGYTKELNSVNTAIEAKNKEIYADLLRDYNEKKQKVIQKVKDVPETEKQEMLELIDQQLQTEGYELAYRLALEQNEEVEKLRKEFAVQKSVDVRAVQQQFIDDVIKMGELSAGKAEWLTKEHKHQQEEVQHLYDDEIAQQRMNLEEKYTRRRALALDSETQWDDHTDCLNLMVSVHMTMAEKLKKNKILSQEKVDEYLNQARSDLQSIKNQTDKEKELKQNDMTKKLDHIKKKSLDEKINKLTTERNDFISKIKAEEIERPLDPISYVKSLVNLKSRHRKELSSLENEIDEAQTKELEVMRDQVAENAKQRLKAAEKSHITKLKTEGVQNDIIDKIMKVHDKEMKDLAAKQLTNRQHREAKLKDDLARRKREWEERKTRERQEQREIRKYEAEIIEKLLCSQVSISDAERQRILKEHEKQMVKFENSLTLNKLKQARLLEEKIVLKRALQLEKLQEKQTAEFVRMRKMAENNGEEDDEETYRKELILEKKHAQQHMALIQGLDFSIEQELQDIRTEIMRDRAFMLKDQEERLGALITFLQMAKARQITEIEEQQTAINCLKASMLDDMNTRGILTSSECERILSIHKEEFDEMNHNLDIERKQKEKTFRAKLEERLQQQERTLLQKQEAEMKSLMDKATNKTSGKIKCALLVPKQMVQMEKFRNKMEREITQTLEDTKRNFETEKQKAIQAKEMQFLAGLVKVASFERSELIDVLHMLFPGRAEEAIMIMLNLIYHEDKQQQKKGLQLGHSTLADRVYSALYSTPSQLHRHPSAMSVISKSSTSSLQHTKKGSKLSPSSRDEITASRSSTRYNVRDSSENYSYKNQSEIQNNYDEYEKSKHLRFVTDDEQRSSQKYRYHEDDEEEEDYIGRALGVNNSHTNAKYSGRLPSLQDQNKPASRKKKSKFLKRLAHQDSEDES